MRAVSDGIIPIFVASHVSAARIAMSAPQPGYSQLVLSADRTECLIATVGNLPTGRAQQFRQTEEQRQRQHNETNSRNGYPFEQDLWQKK
jgi:hypothetical protein